MHGFCGILAVVYALKRAVPRTKRELECLFDETRRILCMSKAKWTRSLPQNCGAICFEQILTLLRSGNCHYKVVQTKCNYRVPSLRQWLVQQLKRKKQCYAEYIVYITGHVVFIRIFPCVGKWLLYDQNGIFTSTSRALWKKNLCGRRLVRHAIKIM